MSWARTTLDRATWRTWGFDLTDEEIGEIDRFFRTWFEVYNRPGVDAYRSQEAIFGVNHAMEQVVGQLKHGRASRGPVSAIRAGYCVAATERDLASRVGRDESLAELFAYREADEGWPGPEPSLGRAVLAGNCLGDVAIEMAVNQPGIARGLQGFALRDAVFADLRHTLFVKLTITTLRRLDGDVGEVLLRLGHAVGVAEESLDAVAPHS